MSKLIGLTTHFKAINEIGLTPAKVCLYLPVLTVGWRGTY